MRYGQRGLCFVRGNTDGGGYGAFVFREGEP
jgi:hypothetical protein